MDKRLDITFRTNCSWKSTCEKEAKKGLIYHIVVYNQFIFNLKILSKKKNWELSSNSNRTDITAFLQQLKIHKSYSP